MPDPDGHSDSFVDNLVTRAKSLHIDALVTPPVKGSEITTVDLPGGASKKEAVAALCRAYAILSGIEERKIGIFYVGDGRNDIPAFEYVTSREGFNRGFLLQEQGASNALFEACPPGTIKLPFVSREETLGQTIGEVIKEFSVFSA